MISLHAKNLESALLAEPHVAVMFPCRTLTRSAKASCRTLRIAEPKALNLEKDYLAEPWNAGSFRKCPQALFSVCFLSGGNKRDKLKGTNAQDSQFFADFRRFLLIFAFPGNYSSSGAQIFAENHRKPQIFAENRRKPQVFAETRLSHLVCPF